MESGYHSVEGADRATHADAFLVTRVPEPGWYRARPTVYIAIEDRRVVARRELNDGPSYRYDRILVSRDLVRRFLEQTSQRLLWCVRSIRYSERALEEFGITPYEERIHDGSCHYIRQAAPFPADRSHDRPRMQSLTQLFGKRGVPEIDLNI